MLAAAALHGGTDPDLLDEVAWWQADDSWQQALLGRITYIRAATVAVPALGDGGRDGSQSPCPDIRASPPDGVGAAVPVTDVEPALFEELADPAAAACAVVVEVAPRSGWTRWSGLGL